MKFDEIKDLKVSELYKKRAEVRRNMFEARMKNVMGNLTNPLTIKEMRRDVARINTVLSTHLSKSVEK